MSSTPPPAVGMLRVVPLLMLVIGTGHFNRVAIGVVGTEQIIPHGGLSESQMGLVYSAFLACYTLAMLPGGWLIDRCGARFALGVWGLGSTALVALTGLVGLTFREGVALWAGLLVARALLGFVNAPLHPSAAHMVHERVAPPLRSSANGLVTFAACVGIASTFTVIGGLTDLVGWPATFLICSGGTLAVALLWLWGTRGLGRRGDVEPSAAGAPHDARAVSALLQPRVLCLACSYGALGYFQYLFFYWVQYFFKDIQHESESTARWYSTAVTLAMGLGMALGGGLTDWLPRSLAPNLRRALVPALGMLGSGVAFEIGLLADDSLVVLVAFMAAAALIGSCEGAFWTTGVELGGRYGGTTAAFMNTIGNLGGTISPAITPILSAYFTARYAAAHVDHDLPAETARTLAEQYGWRMSLGVAGAIVIVGALLWLGVRVPREDAHAAPVERV